MTIAGKQKEASEVEVTEVVQEEQPKKVKAVAVSEKAVHHIVRAISRNPAQVGVGIDNSWTLQMVEEYVNQYLNNGYRLFQVFKMETNPETYNMMYVLVKD